MAADAIAAQPATDALGAGATYLQALVAQAPHLSSLSAAPPRRHHLRQEPDAVIPLVRIRGGGRAQSRSLLRLPAIPSSRWPLNGGQGRPPYCWNGCRTGLKPVIRRLEACARHAGNPAPRSQF